MACSDVQTIKAGDGSQLTFSFDFPYIFKTEIRVYFWNVTTEEWDEKLTTDSVYPWQITDANPTVVEFTSTAPPAPTNNIDNIRIRRVTKVDDILALFNPGSAIRSDDLNRNFEQLRFAIQENTCPDQPFEGTVAFNLLSDSTPQLGGDLDVLTRFITTSTTNGNVILNPNGTGTVDVSTSRITSVTDPTGAQDAATKNYVDTNLNFTQSGTGATTRTVDNKLKDFISVKDFGATGDGTTDDRVAIQAAVDAVKGTNKLLLFPAGDYKLTPATGTINQGTYGAAAEYAILIDDIINIDASAATFTVDLTPANVKHSFAFDGVSGGSFTGGKFVGTNLTGTTKVLFRGCAVAINSSEGVVVSDLVCENLKAGVQLYNSNNCVIKDSLAYRVNQNIQSGTFFGCYSGSFNVISGCTVFGGCEDGDIYCYGTGYGNKILGCKSFNSLYGDDTYALLDSDNQGLGLDANQDSSLVDGCTAYGSYYGIEAKGGTGQCTLNNNLLVRNKIGIAVRAGELDQDVAGHTLISNNTVLPMDGNGNSDSRFGYDTIGIEMSRCPSVTINGNFIGVQESNFFTSVPDVHDFASIVYVNDGSTISEPIQTSDIIISNNRIQHTTQYVSALNQEYSTGPLIYAIAYYTGSTNNIGRGVNFVVEGNTFSPYASSNDGKIIEIKGVSSVTYTGNTHGAMAVDQTTPIVYTNLVPTATYTGNTFERHGTAIKHTYPAIADMPSIQFMFGFIASNNIFGRGIDDTGAPPVIDVDGDGPCIVTGNTQWRVDNGGVPNEGKFLTYDYTTNHALILTNNCVNGPQLTGTWYAVNGTNAATGTNLIIDNNIVTNQ